MRITLASSIVVWHSYTTAYGEVAAIEFWSNWPGLFLQLMLPLFFALSGFLVSGSKLRTPSLITFLVLRVIRLFPALAVEVLLSALILGPIVTTAPLRDYFLSRQFATYFGNLVGWVHFYLPGVFTNNPMPGIVNSPLWTLPFELESYLLLSLVVILGAFARGHRILVLFVGATAGVAAYNLYFGINGTPPGGVNGRVLVLCFFAGMLMCLYRNVIPSNGWIALGTAVLSVVLLRNKYTVYLAPIPAAYFTVYLGLLNPKRTIVVNSGDYSYGTYIYAYPIQQTAALLLGVANSWLLNVSIALPVTIIFALMSWHFVEKPFQRVKKMLRAREGREVKTSDTSNVLVDARQAN